MQLFLKKLEKRLVKGTASGRRMMRLRRLSPLLISKGWFRSVEERLPVDKDGGCLPWFTYPVISFLDGRVQPDMHVFEFGSGNSTLWWSDKVSSVTSCEHSRKWYDRMLPKIPKNVDYLYRELEYGGLYCQTAEQFSNRFDCIIIDGRDRVNCARNSLKALKSDGIIIWDNSDRERYRDGYVYLRDNGFRHIDFWGMGPINSYEWCTSVFYRSDNCFNI